MTLVALFILVILGAVVRSARDLETAVYSTFAQQVASGTSHVLARGAATQIRGARVEFVGLPLGPTANRMLLGIERDGSELELREYSLLVRSDGALYGIIPSNNGEPWHQLHVLEATPAQASFILTER